VALVAALTVLWQQVAHLLLVPSSLPALAAAAILVIALVAVATTVAASLRVPVPAIHAAATSRERSAHVVMTWQKDPDADGHVRPRAPSAAHSVA
jgi:hypothetical protein